MTAAARFPATGLSAKRLVHSTSRLAGLGAFDDTSISEPLQRLLDACATEANLSLLGRVALKGDIRRFLENLARFRREEENAPDILREQIKTPIFVTGLPRSGAGFLHRLLVRDSASLTPRVWQTIHPYPIHPAEHGGEIRKRRVARLLRTFAPAVPGFSGPRHAGSDSPQECGDITAHVFRSPRYDATYHVPSYRSWLEKHDQIDAYRFLKRFLQHLQHQGERGRWILNCPGHSFALDAIHSVFPDARFIFVHRDPTQALLSLTKSTELARRPFTRQIDRLEIGRQGGDRLHRESRHLLRAQASDTSKSICHVRFTDLITDPLGCVEDLYRELDLELTPQTELRISHAVEDLPRGGYRKRPCLAQEFGLDLAVENARFRDYLARFAISPEPPEAIPGRYHQALSL